MGKSSVFQDTTDSGLPDVTHSAAILGASAVGETYRDNCIIESLPFLNLSDAELAAYCVVLSDRLLTLSHQSCPTMCAFLQRPRGRYPGIFRQKTIPKIIPFHVKNTKCLYLRISTGHHITLLWKHIPELKIEIQFAHYSILSTIYRLRNCLETLRISHLRCAMFLLIEN